MSEPRTRRWPKVLAAVVAVLVVLAVVGVVALDRILLSQVRKQTDQLSRELGRPVTVEGVKTKLLGGLGLRITGVAIGPGAGEDVPLLELRRAEVEADLIGAILSRGKSVEVREAVVDGLRVNVVRFPDGATNLERLSKALEARAAAAPPAEEGPAGEEKPADLSFLRVDRAAVENARVAFLDRSVPGAEELHVDDLDVEVRDLRAGKPLEVLVRAAVLAEKQNLELRVKAAPLPPTLVPTPEEITLKVEPVDLDPLAPFLPATVGLRGGRFQADLTVALGAAVPGGQGKTRVQGGFQARQLAFAGQAGGKRLDASLAADLEADAAAGDLRIGKLELEVGPAGLSGRGSASGLRGETPRVEGLELVAHGLDPAVLSEYYPPLRKQLGDVVVAGPVGLSLHGSGTATAQAVELVVDLRPVRLEVPRQLSKAAGAPMSLVARADAAQGGGRVRFDATLELAGADLRPGGTLAKKPGDPMSMRVAGAYRRSGDRTDVELSRVEADLLGDRLSGKGQVALAGAGPKATTRFDLALTGDRLDLDRLLLPAPKEKKAKGAAEPSKPLDPKAFAGLSGVAAARLGLLRMEGVDARDVVLRVKVVEDAVTLEEARLQAFGGSVSAAGTAMKVAHPDEPFTIKADVKGVEGEQLLGFFSKHKVLGGKLDAALELGGRGWKLDPLAKTVTGTLRGDLSEGAFYGKDLVASVAAPIAGRLPFAAGKVTEGGRTSLGKELPFSFRIGDGVARLEKAVQVGTGGGNTLSFEGGVRLDGTLEMPVTLALGPEEIARLTGGRARPKAPIPVTFQLVGPAWSPRLDGLALDGAVKAIVAEAAQGAAGKLLGGKAGAAAGAVADPAKAKAEAEAKAREEAERQKKKLEEEARKRLKGLFGK